MKLKAKSLLILLLFIFCQVFVLAKGGKEKEDKDMTSGSQEGTFMLADFEDPDLEMRPYQGNESKFEVTITDEDKFAGNMAAKVVTTTTDYTGVEITIPEGMGDWSTLRSMIIQVRGGGSNSEYHIVFQDSGEEQFRVTLVDEFTGWQEVKIPLAAFKSRTDWQSDTAVVDQVVDYPVTFLHFFTGNSIKTTMFFDDIIVTDEGNPKDPNEVEEYVELVTPLYSLQELAESYDIVVGAAITPGELKVKEMGIVLPRDFGSLTPGNEMKFYSIKADPEGYNFGPADELVAFAEDNDMLVRGHTLVWHAHMPAWLEEGAWTKDELLDILHEFINETVTRYKGKVYAWDVVNEPFADNGDLRVDESVWARVIGPEYIEQAFIWAREADPDAKLFLNDYNVAETNAKSNGMYEYVQMLLEKGVPVDGIGAQMHLMEAAPPNFKRVYDNMVRFTELGLEIHLTEVDVRIQTPVTPEALEHQAEIYSNIFKIAMAFESITNVTTWGVSDAYSWIPSTFPGYTDALMFDKYFNPKPAYTTVQVDLVAGPGELDFLTPLAGRHVVVPFKAVEAAKVPVVDGKNSSGEWDGAIVYPFTYDQLNGGDLNPPAQSDLYGNWRVVYSGNTVYGAVVRQDDITNTSAENSWENDTVEVFYGIDDDFAQLRTLVGQDFEGGSNVKAAWNADGTFCEFSVQLPPDVLAGKIIGWNIGLADNDGGDTRESQLYPIPGVNIGWKGEGFGEIEFVKGDKAERLGVAHLIPPFIAKAAKNIPVIDGKAGANEWTGIVYPLGFNQLSATDLSTPDEGDIKGSWSIVYDGDTIYGIVRRSDDITDISADNIWENDAIEVFFDMGGIFTQLRTLVGEGFGDISYDAPYNAVWSADGSIVEFSVVLPGSLQGELIGWNIALSDNDGSGRDIQLYSINGTNNSWQGIELCEIIFE